MAGGRREKKSRRQQVRLVKSESCRNSAPRNRLHDSGACLSTYGLRARTPPPAAAQPCHASCPGHNRSSPPPRNVSLARAENERTNAQSVCLYSVGRSLKRRLNVALRR